MPTPANASSLRTTRATRLRQVLVWAVIGTIISLALVAASPWIAGQGSLSVTDAQRESRWQSWLRTRYGMLLVGDADSPPSIDADLAVRTLHSSDFSGLLRDDFYVDGATLASFGIVEVGFPLRSFSGWVILDHKPKTPKPAVRLGQGLLQVRGSPLDAIPFTPHWPALLFNAAAWSLALWSISFCPAALRRTLRLRRGLCPHCAYDLRATPSTTPCPECGHPRR